MNLFPKKVEYPFNRLNIERAFLFFVLDLVYFTTLYSSFMVLRKYCMPFYACSSLENQFQLVNKNALTFLTLITINRSQCQMLKLFLP